MWIIFGECNHAINKKKCAAWMHSVKSSSSTTWSATCFKELGDHAHLWVEHLSGNKFPCLLRHAVSMNIVRGRSIFERTIPLRKRMANNTSKLSDGKPFAWLGQQKLCNSDCHQCFCIIKFWSAHSHKALHESGLPAAHYRYTRGKTHGYGNSRIRVPVITGLHRSGF